MSIVEQKKLYAKKLVELNGNAFQAALSILGPGCIGGALQMNASWSNDPIVLAEVDRVRNSNTESCTPTKLTVLETLWDMINNPSTKSKERIDALKLYSELKGYVADKSDGDKASINVMIVKDHGDDNEWEKKTMSQQKALVGMNTPVGKGNL